VGSMSNHHRAGSNSMSDTPRDSVAVCAYTRVDLFLFEIANGLGLTNGIV